MQDEEAGMTGCHGRVEVGEREAGCDHVRAILKVLSYGNETDKMGSLVPFSTYTPGGIWRSLSQLTNSVEV